MIKTKSAEYLLTKTNNKTTLVTTSNRRHENSYEHKKSFSVHIPRRQNGDLKKIVVPTQFKHLTLYDNR